MKYMIVMLGIAVLMGATAAPAAITGIDGGTAAPAATLGSYLMTPFPADGSPLFSDVMSVSSPFGGSVDFGAPLNHRVIGSGWMTWSHGYTGDVYYTNGAHTLTLTLPDDTGAFYFYAEPNPFDVYTIVATAQDGTTISQGVNGNSGAAYYGFYGTDGSLISSITVTSSRDFAIGEFGIALGGLPVVPAPGAILLGTLGTALVGWFRRSRTL